MNGNLMIGSVLPIICDYGYELQGGYGVECMSDGCWYTNASCIPGKIHFLMEHNV